MGNEKTSFNLKFADLIATQAGFSDDCIEIVKK
jgi:hypothetical protein